MPGAIAEDRERIGSNEPPLAATLELAHADLAEEVAEIARRANETPRKITTEEDLDGIAALVKETSALGRKVDDVRKRVKEPYLSAGRTVDAFFGAFADRLDRIRKTFEAVATDYQKQRIAEERRRREEEAAKLRAEEERKRQEAEAAKRAATQERKLDQAAALAERAEEAEIAAAAPAAEIARTRTESGVVASAKTEVTFEIVDYEAIDLNRLRPYLARADVEKAIRSLVKIQKMATSLPGIRVFEDVRATFR